MNISFSAGVIPSKQYKAEAKDYLANHRAEVAKMSSLERQMAAQKEFIRESVESQLVKSVTLFCTGA